jgi:hypothetical protein
MMIDAARRSAQYRTGTPAGFADGRAQMLESNCDQRPEIGTAQRKAIFYSAAPDFEEHL